uniref:Methyltransferase domain-containing protein n=1 Tax=Staphylothermus marinus TaxID=2280 RepID=A0A7J3KH33_STAMA
MGQKENYFAKKEKVYGQFFTPPLVADFIVRFALMFLDGRERAIDPACGDGVFLAKLINAGFREVWGVDIDPHVLDLIPINVRERAKILIMDALSRGGLLESGLPENYFDLVVGNPPFSSKYGRVSDTRLLLYELGRGRSSQAIEVLFLERFIQLARKDGVIGIILPEGIFASKSLVDVRKFILKYRVLAVVSLPRGVFRGTLSTSSKTHILFLKKTPNNGENVLMIETNSLVELEGNIEDLLKRGISVKPQIENLTPRFYTSVDAGIGFKTGLEVKTLDELVEEIKTGATEYGVKRVFSEKGLRFISAKIVTPLGLDFSRDERFVEPGSHMDKPRAHVKPGDILFVRVGVGCSGRACVVVDDNDLGIADDWIYIIRLKDKEYLPYYVAIYMQSKLGRMQIERMKRGVGTVNIPKTELLKLKIPIPPTDVLKEIKNKYVEMVVKLRKGEKKEAEKIFSDLLNLVEKITVNT